MQYKLIRYNYININLWGNLKMIKKTINKLKKYVKIINSWKKNNEEKICNGKGKWKQNGVMGENIGYEKIKWGYKVSIKGRVWKGKCKVKTKEMNYKWKKYWKKLKKFMWI